jgi:proteic killer suppression protein
MEIRFASPDLERLYVDPAYTGGRAPAVVSNYRKRVGVIEAAADERDFYTLRSLRFEKLKGKRDHQYSMRINDQWRLILELEGKGASKVVAIVSIEDYH